MAYDIFTPESLMKAVSVLPKPSTFFRDTFFKTRNTHNTTKVRVDFRKGNRSVAPFVSEVLPSGVTKKIGYVTDDFETPLVKVTDVTNIGDLMKRDFGENVFGGVSPQERAYKQLLRTMNKFDDQITRREELSCAQAMLDGKITVKGDNVNYEIDFGFSNKGTVSSLWDDENSKANPVEDLAAMALACKKDGYRRPNICLMERSAYNAFINRCMELGLMDNQYFLNTMIAPKIVDDAVTYCGHIKDLALDIYIYDEWYIDDWSGETPVEKSVMPKGKVMLASTQVDFSIEYGVNVFADEDTKDFYSVEGTRAADSWVTKNPDQRYLSLQSRPLPVPAEVDSWYVGTVSATE
jgi:hypothetical protein